MISKWTSHCKTQEEKQAFQNRVLGSKEVLDRLQTIVKEMCDEQDSIERNPKLYELPNWDYRQAHLNGFKDCLNKINKILNLDQQEQ